MFDELVGQGRCDTRTEVELLHEIAKFEPIKIQESNFPRFEILNEIKHQLMLIWETLDWLQSERLSGIRIAILLNSNYSVFYSFWNLCGKLINEVHSLGHNFDSHGPSLLRILTICKDSDIESKLISLVRKYRLENGSIQTLIKSNRDANDHKDMLSFSNIDRLKHVSIEETRLRVDYSSRVKLTEEQAFTLQLEGFFELREFLSRLIELFDRDLSTSLS